MAHTFPARFPGVCACGARFAKGAKVKWERLNGVQSCPACRARVVETVEAAPFFVKVYAKGGTLHGFRFIVADGAELSGLGFDMRPDGSAGGFVGTRSPMTQGDLIDYFPAARRWLEARRAA